MTNNKQQTLTPKDKAIYLIHLFNRGGYGKMNAMSCVDEILEAIDWHEFETPNLQLYYWEKVKTEIQKL